MAQQMNKWEDPLLLQAALEGLQLQKQRVEAQISEVRAQLGKPHRKRGSGSPANGSTSSRRVLSVEARKRIAAAQRKRWAEYRETHAHSK